jgi:hypothetical protein
MTRNALRLTCLGALVLALAPAAQARAEKLPFDVTVKGTIDEGWTRSWDRTQGDCDVHADASGAATIRFETPRPQRVAASIDDGWVGKPRLRITSERSGTQSFTGLERAENGRFFCDPEPEVHGGACGNRTATVPLDLSFDSSPFRLKASGESGLWPSDCVYTPSPFVYSLYEEQGWDTLGLLERSRLKLKQRYSFWVFGGGDARGREIKARRSWTFHKTRRITLPYRESKGGPPIGSLTAEVDWTITFRRIGKIRRPPR